MKKYKILFITFMVLAGALFVGGMIAFVIVSQSSMSKNNTMSNFWILLATLVMPMIFLGAGWIVWNREQTIKKED